MSAKPEIAPVPMAEYVRRLVETWPPITPEQADRIAVLLQPGVPK